MELEAPIKNQLKVANETETGMEWKLGIGAANFSRTDRLFEESQIP